MQKLGTATITIEPHTFDATFYVVREAVPMPVPPVKPPLSAPSTPFKPPGTLPTTKPKQEAPPNTPNLNSGASPQPAGTSSTATQPPTAAGQTASKPAPSHITNRNPVPNPPKPAMSQPNTTVQAQPSTASPAQIPARTATPPAAKTTDPVIQMLAQRAAVDPHLKELMKIVAASEATPEQLREFQKHIDGFNALVRKQESEREARAKLAAATGTPHPLPSAAHPSHYGIARGSPLNPHCTPNPVHPRPEPLIKHIVIEFTSQPVAGQPPVTDRWLFPEYAVLDTQYGGTEMTCSFFAEKSGSDILARLKDLSPDEMQVLSPTWKADTNYYQPVTFTIRASQPRTLESIARSAKSLPEVQKYMQQVMDNKSRAPHTYLVHQLPRDKVDNAADFVDSGVDMDDEDVLKDFYPM